MAQDPRRKPPQTMSQSQNLEEQVRRRAYELFEAQGSEDGHDLDDWLRAEEEVIRQKARAYGN